MNPFPGRCCLAAALCGVLAMGCQSTPRARADKADPDATDVWIATRLAETARHADDPPPHGIKPTLMAVKLVATYPHDPQAFTQGLTLRQGELYESTGLNGASSVRQVDIASGKVLQQTRLPEEHFAEGLAWVKDQLYQLTLSSRVMVYDATTLAKVRELPSTGENWGLCFDGTQLVTSNGSDTLVMRNADTFAETGRLRVKIEGGGFWIGGLNAIECVGDFVYANVWPTDSIVKIDRRTGDVTAVIDASSLPAARERDHSARVMNGLVMNGIAYRPETDTFLLTGKMWSQLYEVKLVPAP